MPLASLARRASGVCGAVVALVGGAVLLGWVMGNETVTRVLPGLASMKFNTALCFVLSGVSLLLLRERAGGSPRSAAGWGFAAFVLALAAGTALQDALGVSFGIDELVIRDLTRDPASSPGRMSVGTALGFFVMGGALLSLGRKWRYGSHAAQVLSIFGTLIGGTAVLGYGFGVQALYRFPVFSSMAIHTAVQFVVLGVGVLLARPEHGLVSVFVSGRVGGRALRRALPAVVLVPVAFGGLSYAGVRGGLYEAELGFALTSILSIVILAAVVWTGAASLDRLHERIEQGARADAFLASIVESSDDAIVSKDLNGVITSWNPAAERIYGYTAEEILGEPMTRLIPSDGLDEEREVLAKVASGEAVEQLQCERRHKDGRLLEMLITVSPLVNEAKEVIGASNIGRDITERRRAEGRFRLAVEAAPNAMVMIDGKGGIVLVNSAAETMFGYTRDELVGRPIEILLPRSSRDVHRDLRDGFLREPEQRPMGEGRDLFGCRRDGSEFPVEIGLNPIETPEGTFVLSAVVDISRRKQDEAALQKSARELARSNRDLEQFAYAASHDLQEPLRAVARSVRRLERDHQGNLDAKADELIARTVDGVERMRALIEDLLAFSRVGREGRSRRECDLNESVAVALKNLATSIRDAGAEVRTGAMPTLRAVPAELTLVFQNLIGNSVKFRRKDTPPRVRVHAELRGEEWVFSVEDNGIGVAPKDFERVFAVFQRLHPRGEYPGTGIGLALCQRIVEHHGGRIWLEAPPDGGTVFLFSLPRATGSSGADLPEDLERSSGAPPAPDDGG